MGRQLNPLAIAVIAVMTAVTTVFTLAVRVPVPATNGYVNLSDVAIYFTAFAFGPWVGLIAGGVGTALADLIGGYAQFALLTFFAHGLEGFVAGWLGRDRQFTGMVVAWLAGAVVMCGLYLLGEGLVLTGWGPALWELPFNAFQNLVGAVVGIPLVLAVRRAYPPLIHMLSRQAWREE
ncbi:MAG: ECF transporter S component [Chloroflexi bacterium]|nr:ECF transporter S component [Chloroflexota bacterium]